MDSLEPTEGNRDELILKQQRDIEKEVMYYRVYSSQSIIIPNACFGHSRSMNQFRWSVIKCHWPV